MDFTIHNPKLLIPIELLSFICTHKLHRPLQLFLYLKCHSSGKLKAQSPVWSELQKTKAFRDPRTLSKNLKVLLQLQWIGYNSKTGVYFIRSFENIRRSYDFKSRKSVEFEVKDFNNFRAFVQISIVNAKINAHKFYFEVAMPRKLNTAPKHKDGANQYYAYKGKAPDYYGMSNKGLAKLLNISQTAACDLKHAAEQAGFIVTRPKSKQFCLLDSPDWTLRAQIESIDASLRGKLRFRRAGNKIVVFEQLHDEIIPRLKMKQRPKFFRGISFLSKNVKNTIIDTLMSRNLNKTKEVDMK